MPDAPSVRMLPQGVECAEHGEARACGLEPGCGHRRCIAVYLGKCPACEERGELRTHGAER
jgi:hypothetical protein